MSDQPGGDTEWHLRKEVNIGHIIATVSALFAAFVWGNKIETRLTRAEAERAAIDQRIDDRDEQFGAALGRIDGHLIRIETKLDRKVDK